MKNPRPTTVDFETFGIEQRPHFPPVPVSVSIKKWGRTARAYIWGHTTGNNCTWPQAYAALKEVWDSDVPLLFQNGSFDIDVALVHFGLPQPAWDRLHETMFLLFLDDPHQALLALKPSAERLLGWPTEDRDEVLEWLVKHQPVPGIKISRSKTHEHYAMKYIPFAPGGLVGEYANGDARRTEAIFNLLWPKTIEREMLDAYNRERRLAPCLLDMERQGLPVDVVRLRSDVDAYTAVFTKVEAWIRAKVNRADLNIDSGADLVAAMVAAGVADEDKLPLTAKSRKPQTNKAALMLAVTDEGLLALLRYRAGLKTCLGTFMKPWLKIAEANNGVIYAKWNQIRSAAGAGTAGTRTGRLSATWLMNIPKEFTPIFKHEEPDRAKAKALPKCPIKGLPSIPRVRSYLVPFHGEVLIDRDYSQQEPRILAHFDGGDLMDRYNENPWIDFHDYAKAELEKMGKFYERRPVKNTNLGLIYGMGAGTLAEKNDMSVREAGDLKKAILTLYPGLKDMYADMKMRAKANQPIRTWGGREYYCEPPKYDRGRGRWMEFDYKLINVLIQGSAADCTKTAIINWDNNKKPHWRPLLLNVHDQLTASVPPDELHEAMACLRQCMESVDFDVPMLTEGSISFTNWEDLVDYDKKGERLNG